MPKDAEKLHDDDWLTTKSDERFFEESDRYSYFLQTIAGLGGRTLLDVGCGSGYLGRQLKVCCPDTIIHGIDISSVALERASQAMDDVWQVNLDQSDLPMPSDRYDAVVCIEVLEHLYDPDHALSEICRVLVRGGRAVISVPNLAYWRYRLTLLSGHVPPPASDRRHLQQYDRRTLESCLSSAGLRPLRVTGFGVRFRRLAARHPALFSDILIATATKTS